MPGSLVQSELPGSQRTQHTKLSDQWWVTRRTGRVLDGKPHALHLSAIAKFKRRLFAIRTRGKLSAANAREFVLNTFRDGLSAWVVPSSPVGKNALTVFLHVGSGNDASHRRVDCVNA